MRAKESRSQTFYVAWKLKSTCAQPTRNHGYNSLTQPSRFTAHQFAPLTQVNKCKIYNFSLNLKMSDNFGPTKPLRHWDNRNERRTTLILGFIKREMPMLNGNGHKQVCSILWLSGAFHVVITKKFIENYVKTKCAKGEVGTTFTHKNVCKMWIFKFFFCFAFVWWYFYFHILFAFSLFQWIPAPFWLRSAPTLVTEHFLRPLVC